jgi:hypothetical protein
LEAAIVDKKVEIVDKESEIVELQRHVNETRGEIDQGEITTDPKDLQILKLHQKSIKGKQREIKANQMLIEEKETNIKANQIIIEETRGKFLSDTTNLCCEMDAIHTSHKLMRQCLCQYKAMGNESTDTQTYMTQNSTPSVDSRINYNMRASPSVGQRMIQTESTERTIKFRHDLIKLVDDDTQIILRSFQAFVTALDNSAIEYNHDDKTHDHYVSNTIEAILKWKDHDKFVKTNSTYARPSSKKDNETKVDHPILQAVISRIIHILIRIVDGDEVLHRQEIEVTTERTMRDPNQKPKYRRIDITTQKREELVKMMPPVMLQTPIEIKVARQDTNQFYQALVKGRQQIFGHISKLLEHYFDFAGIGKNASAAGVSLTLQSIEVIEMNLSGVGTEKVKIDTLSTGVVPLLGRELWSDDNVKMIPESLPVENELEGYGFILLAGALMRNHIIQDKIKHTMTEENAPQIVGDDNKPLGENFNQMSYLGSGAFSNVYKVDEGEFLKLSRAASLEKSLEEEANILQLLQKIEKGKKKCDGIPQFVSSVKIRFVIRSEISIMKGLRLNGIIGKPLHSIYRSDWNVHRKSIIMKAFEALEYAHAKSIRHLDVRAGNVIVKIVDGENDKSACSVMLSDWGCSVATKKNQKNFDHFRGSTAYAHDDFLGKTAKFPLIPEVDFASLAYTIDHVEHGKLRWAFDFDRPTNVDDQDKTIRQDLVHEWLVEKKNPRNELVSQLPANILDTLVKACKIRKRRSQRLKKKKEKIP